MKVNDLIDKLSKLDGNSEIYIRSDSGYVYEISDRVKAGELTAAFGADKDIFVLSATDQLGRLN